MVAELLVEEASASDSFEGLGLSGPVLQAVGDVGYEQPTPIQRRTIPLLLEGKDVTGQAQTGTGKTAAFALPILQRLDVDRGVVQALVLTPTRELALQVAEAFHTYSKPLGTVRVVPIYGGDSIVKQMTHLRRGAHVVVGTPGRIMDHLRRGTLDLSSLQTVVLDEADEMLRMGFLEDVEWILGNAPDGRQTALFSATMPREVRRIADRYLKDPVPVEIEHRTMTVPTISQNYVHVAERQKLDVLTHFLEVEGTPGEAALIFARTKLRAAELNEKLQARGYASEALHGDMGQPQREAVVRRLKGGKLELVVATDVAARGLDVERIGHVINYDMPSDVEAYVHRVGRTGRAGRAGRAILFVTPRERRMLTTIERGTGQKMTPLKIPTPADVEARRSALFKERLIKTLEENELELNLTLVEEVAEASGRDMAEVAAAAVRLARGDRPVAVAVEPESEQFSPGEAGMARLFIDAGRMHGVRPADIVGAIANEAGIPGKSIGAIDIYDHYTLADVPADRLEQVLAGMRGVTVRGQAVRVRAATSKDRPSGPRARAKPKHADTKKRKRPARD